MWQSRGRVVAGGILAFAALLAVYFVVLTLISGFGFSVSQFVEFWPFLIALAAGFGAQVGLYLHVKRLSANHQHDRRLVAASGTTSTAAMLACCTHYLANILPVLGTVGLVGFVAQYQTGLFWVALAFNAVGLVFIGRQALLARRHFAGSPSC